jgi:hypothetical protein
MATPALTRTRIAISLVLAGATLTTATLAASLASAQARKDSTAGAVASGKPTAQHSPGTGRTTRPSTHVQRPATPGPGFGQPSPAHATTQPSHTRTKGS